MHVFGIPELRIDCCCHVAAAAEMLLGVAQTPAHLQLLFEVVSNRVWKLLCMCCFEAALGLPQACAGLCQPGCALSVARRPLCTFYVAAACAHTGTHHPLVGGRFWGCHECVKLWVWLFVQQ